jgi:hypothetical protein
MSYTVYVVENRRPLHLFTLIEFLGIVVLAGCGFYDWLHFPLALALFFGLSVACAYLQLLAHPSTFWIVSLTGMVLWGWVGFHVSAGVLHHHWFWQCVAGWFCIVASTGEKAAMIQGALERYHEAVGE